MASRARKPRDPFEVALSVEDREKLARRLVMEIEDAQTVREQIVGDDGMLDAWHRVYEGGDRKITKNTPWPGAANLTSWIGTEQVDSFRSRVVKTIFTEPIWIVSGWGKSPEQCCFVEEFHQWKAEETRLQTLLTKVVHNALIEGTGVLEVSERPVLRKMQQRIKAMVQTTPDGTPIGDPVTGAAQPIINEGRPMEAPEGTPEGLYTDLTVSMIAKVRNGPQYRVLDLKDFLLLPGHAKERSEVWGYAKRAWKRLPDLTALQQLGVYQDVKEIGEHDERSVTPEMTREGQGLAHQEGPTAEKEIWELTFLDDLDEDGIQEWYVATLHLPSRTLLRLQKDDLGQARYILFIPFPRTKFIYGYSLIGHKLETIIDEHTAWRNMIADRAKLVIQAPLKRLIGSLWNPAAKPWGPGAVIDVRDMREVEAMTIPDVPNSVIHREEMIMSAAVRVSGMGDTASGSHPQEDRTLGEVKMVTGEGLIRIEEVIKHLQEAMEDLFQINHEIWKRTLREQKEKIPNDLMVSLEARGMTDVPREITSAMLEGQYRGKPRGSVETADLGVMRSDFIQFMTALTQFSQAIPTVNLLFQDPELGKQLLMQAVRVFRWENKAAFEAAIQQSAQKVQLMQIMNGGMLPGAAGPAAKPGSTAGSPPPQAKPKGKSKAAPGLAAAPAAPPSAPPRGMMPQNE